MEGGINIPGVTISPLIHYFFMKDSDASSNSTLNTLGSLRSFYFVISFLPFDFPSLLLPCRGGCVSEPSGMIEQMSKWGEGNFGMIGDDWRLEIVESGGDRCVGVVLLLREYGEIGE